MKLRLAIKLNKFFIHVILNPAIFKIAGFFCQSLNTRWNHHRFSVFSHIIMNNTFNKYFGLLTLILGTIVAIPLVLACIFYVLKLFSVTIFNLPGTELIYRHIITLVPYLIYFSAYFYINKKIGNTPALGARVMSRFFLIIGVLAALTGMVFSLFDLYEYPHVWILFFHNHSYLVLITQILLLFFTTMSLASGDAKEKDWIQRQS